jgi:NitT/TauT family transport system ATP-binding protein
LPRPRSWDVLNDDARFKELTGRVLQLVRSA